MISEMGKHTGQNRNVKNEYIPPLLTWSMIIFILCFVLSARMIASVNKNEASIAVFSEQVVTSQEQKLVVEQDIDKVIDPILELYNHQSNKSDYELLMNLREKIRTKYLSLRQNELELLQSDIADLQDILESEKMNEFHSMSLEGRRISIYIIREIFGIYGYQVSINPDGGIEEIADQSGKLIYSMMTMNNDNIQYNGLIILLSVLAVALILCVLIARKHQLFVKEVRCDGFDTKRYA